MPESTWEDALRGGDLPGALALVKESIRGNPKDADLRLVYLHLAALGGNWDTAQKQLKLYGELAAGEETHLLVLTLSSLIESEEQRQAVLAGERDPLIFADPLPWVAHLIQMNRHLAAGEFDAALQCRERVAGEADPVPGTIDDQRFAWLGDTDSRFPAVIEAIIGGAYYWLPLERLRKITFGKPKGLRDLIWSPVNFQFINEGESPGFIPVRYPGSETSENHDLVLSRGTVWDEVAPGFIFAKGQRVLTDGDHDYSQMDVRRIEFEHPEVEPAG